MTTLIDKWAHAIAEQFVFRVPDIIWEMTWIETIPEQNHATLMERGILKALWHVTEYFFQDAYISKEHLSYILAQDSTLGSPNKQAAKEDGEEDEEEEDKRPTRNWRR